MTAEPKASDLALSLSAISKRFGGVDALTDVTVEVARGARYGIIGPNGSGKTTLFNVVSGELSATAGHVGIFGEDVTHKTPPHRVSLGVGRTYQITRTFTPLTVRENLMLGLLGLNRSKFSMLRRWRSDKGQTAEIEGLAVRFGLQDRLDSCAADLSHGEVRQLEVAIALALKPRLLLLDEPGAGLSPGERVTMTKLISDLPEDLTLVMIEHDMDMVRDLVATITVLHFGQVVVAGTTAPLEST